MTTDTHPRADRPRDLAGNVLFSISMSLDGFITAPHDTREQARGEDGQRLHAWVFDRKIGDDAAILDELLTTPGAPILGRRSCDNDAGAAEGWPDGEGPYGKTPSFVVTTIPDFTHAPTFQGATGGQIAALVLRHVVAAAVITGMLTGLARPQGR